MPERSSEMFFRLVEIICGWAFLTFAAGCLGADFWHAGGFAFWTVAAVGFLNPSPIRGAEVER